MTKTRLYFENIASGEVGWLVNLHAPERDVTQWPAPEGVSVGIRYREQEPVARPFRAAEWRERGGPRPMEKLHRAAIAHAAMRELARVLGDYHTSRLDLNSMKDEERAEYVEKGPKSRDPKAAGDIRGRLWDAIMGVLASPVGDDPSHGGKRAHSSY